MKNSIKKSLKTSNGITLIALVITIIVLLILAGISISMLSGDNSILQKATDAKTFTSRASVVEQARTDILGYQAENKGTDLQKSQLQTVLEKYFKEVPDLENMSDTEILNKELETIAEYGTHTITVKEIFNGNFSENNQLQVATPDEINAKIGTVVTGYSAKDIEWQVYYADNNETFLIAKTAETPKWGWSNSIPFKGDNKDVDYSGSTDVRNSTYGSNWNKKWLSKCSSSESTLDNAKAIAYLCDSDNWTDYKTGSANYAVGAPTIELLIASWNKSQEASVELADIDVAPKGIAVQKPSEIYGILAENIKNGTYNNGHDYWLASPIVLGNDDDGLQYVINYQYIAGKKPYSNVSLRPIVSIPTSKISINGDIVTILP